MTTMLAQLPDDQRALILERLGEQLVAEISARYEGTEAHKTAIPETSGDRIRATRRMVEPISLFYQACLQKMGSAGAAGGPPPKLPSPENAWLEVTGHPMRFNVSPNDEPSFTHPMIGKTVLMFGGWAQMWREFGDLKQSSARWRFIRAYKGVIGDTK